MEFAPTRGSTAAAEFARRPSGPRRDRCGGSPRQTWRPRDPPSLEPEASAATPVPFIEPWARIAANDATIARLHMSDVAGAKPKARGFPGIQCQHDEHSAHHRAYAAAGVQVRGTGALRVAADAEVKN